MHPLADILIALRFFSRLPVPATRREVALGSSGLAAATSMVPLAGAIIGLGPALVLVAAEAVGLPRLVGATLAIIVLVISTGALHEDALADCADGFGGGQTRERKLAIMRDSRIGAFGACAIGLSLLLRVAAFDAVAGKSLALAAFVLVAGAAVSRTLSLLPLVLLPPARSEGAGAGAGKPNRFLIAGVLAALIGLLPLLAGASLARVMASLALSTTAALGMVVLARRQIGGQTGDVAGATQQLAEIAILLVFSATL
jgi:adenosylcobinamide-GDP ribazoletransferase